MQDPHAITPADPVRVIVPPVAACIAVPPVAARVAVPPIPACPAVPPVAGHIVIVPVPACIVVVLHPWAAHRRPVIPLGTDHAIAAGPPSPHRS
ncbi:hypothetical protein ACH4LE_33505 [Streptomyces sp. NPDC017413]|uniref:hypothetical protein n=1 Tax=Streptomyces sp. NPDC017413 TaxID=3364994 RepID=UPI003787F6E7